MPPFGRPGPAVACGMMTCVSATVQARDVSAGHGARVLFSGVNLVVAPGEVIGLVGVNGAGKSTLLRLLAGVESPEQGSVLLTPPEATVGFLAQEVERRPGEDVTGHLARRTRVAAAESELTAATEALTAAVAGSDDRYAHALERYLALGAADLPKRTGQVVADLGLDIDLTLPMTALSGGQAARVGLAALLLSRFDVLLLDEPTNDLDLDGLARLERFVIETAARGAAVVLVSHDREFLARTVSGVVELDLAQQRVGVYGGGYAAYLAEREVARRHAREAYDEYAGTVAGLQERARMQRGWLDGGVRKAVIKARDNDKIGRNKRVEQTEKQAAKVSQTERAIERLPEVVEPRKEWELRYRIQAAPRSSAVVTVARGAVARLGSFTLGPVDLQIDAGDRVGITGPNGSGKSTLLRVLLDRVPLAAGAVSVGPSVAVGEVDQARQTLSSDGQQAPSVSLLRRFADQVPDWAEADVRTLLAKFGLTGDHVTRPPLSLSPGERTRAALALLQARGVNLLVLDEPTNHLDLPAIEQLEVALAEYTGTLLLVTHDRRMLDTVRLTRRISVDDGRITEV